MAKRILSEVEVDYTTALRECPAPSSPPPQIFASPETTYTIAVAWKVCRV